MRVVWIHPAPGGEAGPRGAPYPVLPVGGVAHANRLRALGHEVVGLDVPVSRVAEPGFVLDVWLAARPAPDLVLLDLHWAEHAAGVVDAAARARRAWPSATVAVGGLTATRFAEELLALCPAVDLVLRGDVEGPLEALVGGEDPCRIPNLALRDGRGGARLTPHTHLVSQAALDDMDSVDVSWLEHGALYRQLSHSRPARLAVDLRRPPLAQWVPTGRGCAFSCSTCGGSRTSHAALRGSARLQRRAPSAVSADLRRLQAEGVQQAATTLDPDMLGGPWRRAFLEGVPRGMGLYVEGFQLPSPGLLDGLAAACDLDHTELALTPLSGSEATRRLNGKHYGDARLIEALDAARARDLSVFLFFSLNLPGEDERSLEATCALVEGLLARWPARRLRVINICHTLDPESPVHADPAAFGVSRVSLRTLSDHVAYGLRPRPFGDAEEERGFVVPGRDLRAMRERWDALAAQHEEVFAVPRV